MINFKSSFYINNFLINISQINIYINRLLRTLNIIFINTLRIFKNKLISEIKSDLNIILKLKINSKSMSKILFVLFVALAL